jgi:hypothetical protein
MMSFTTASSFSTAFDKTRRLSRILSVLFTVAFFVTLADMVWLLAMPLWTLRDDSVAAHLASQMNGFLSVAGLRMIPSVFILHHGRKLFDEFARGEIFATKPIANMRAIGLWLVISFFTGFIAYGADMILVASDHIKIKSPLPTPEWSALFAGIATTIAAHVMAEAQRIAADNAEIV